MRLRFNPEISVGNLVSAALAVLFAGGIIVRIGMLEKAQDRATQERVALAERIVGLDEKLSMRVLDLDKKMERVLTILEERTRPAVAGGK